ncbi:hypothetical protein HBI56_028110 [Parastagonospora nodorum]|nr:hypothetical protein HBI05_136320 [Parastagonospora nodorum]KAH4242454.1 hypothetical protein HBI06_016240 [Parastagonospora nodorum]KAH4342983.1 hypothetical protein HBH98_158120 [Parastagonospora nodorum]KAH4384840.1 hypothetical protein HBH97_070500 [Parastagonospora nodorum]KAH4390502.1 hypothetical protein HBH94_016650 [Parastagonospora nodorum]
MPAQVELAHHLSVARFPCQVPLPVTLFIDMITLQMHYSFGQYKPVWANISSVQMSALLAWSSYRS